MTKFSANLGFLWKELSLPDAIRAAADAGFEAVECHFPYDVDPTEVQSVLSQTGLPMLGLNTRVGDAEKGEFGLSALPGREEEARHLIDEAFDYAAAIGCRAVHVMAGKSGGTDEAQSVFKSNLAYAAKRAATMDATVLIEPINQRDAPGYHHSTVEEARAIINSVGHDNIKVMFDCYHLQISQGDLLMRLKDNLDAIGHIQIAAVPDRGEPDAGEVDYTWLLQELDELPYDGFVGAEYKPRLDTNSGLAWLKAFQA